MTDRLFQIYTAVIFLFMALLNPRLIGFDRSRGLPANLRPEIIPFRLLYEGEYPNLGSTQADPKSRPATASAPYPDAAELNLSKLAKDASGISYKTKASWLYAVAPDGRQQWRFFVADAKRKVDIVASDSDTIYLIASNGFLYALRKKDGKPRWSLRIPGTIEGLPSIDGGFIRLGVQLRGQAGVHRASVNPKNGEFVWLAKSGSRP